MTSKKWSTERTIKFLEIYEKIPLLWDPKSEQYSKRKSRDEACKQLASQMAIEGFTSSEVKTKIRSIRNAYSLELIKIAKSRKNANSDEEVYQPRVAWFPVADRFLRDVINLKGSALKEPYESEYHSDTPSMEARSFADIQKDPPREEPEIVPGPAKTESDTQEHQQEPEPKRIKRIRPTSTSDQFFTTETLMSHPHSNPHSNDNELECFGKYIASQLKRLPESVALESMNFMQSHLMEKRMRYCRDASAAFSGDDCP